MKRFLKNSLEVFKKTMRYNKNSIVIPIIIYLLVIVSFVFIKIVYNYWEIFNITVSTSTFFLALIIGYNDYRKKWENSLPSKLTTHFKFEDFYVMSCYRAYLISENDIRNWGQQIGSQINENSRLAFDLKIELKEMEIIDYSFKHYEVTFFLSKEPENLKGKYITWAFSEDKFIKRTNERTKSPLTLEQALTQNEDNSNLINNSE